MTDIQSMRALFAIMIFVGVFAPPILTKIFGCLVLLLKVLNLTGLRASVHLEFGTFAKQSKKSFVTVSIKYSCCSVCGRAAMARRESSVGTKMLSCFVIAARRLSGLRLIVVPVDCMEVIR